MTNGDAWQQWSALQRIVRLPTRSWPRPRLRTAPEKLILLRRISRSWAGLSAAAASHSRHYRFPALVAAEPLEPRSPGDNCQSKTASSGVVFVRVAGARTSVNTLFVRGPCSTY